jgi:dipeptidyl aminopeptidase/acylaminoacyl peptidase
MLAGKLRFIVGAGALALLLACFATALHKYRGQQRLFFPKRVPVKLPAASSGLRDARDVSFRAGAIELRGWYVPSRNRASIILAHGAGGNRAALAPEAKALSERGFGVLLFDWPGHGESGGEIHWNQGERASLQAALTWLTQQPDVAHDRIGAYGFSMGGYVVAQVAARDSRLSAVVLASTPANQREQVRFQHGRLWLLGELPALLALERGGMLVDAARPMDEVALISPRWLMLVGGARDVIVPPSMTPALYAKALEPKRMLMLEEAGHGDYAKLAGAKYLDPLCGFFQEALLSSPS